MNDQAYETQLMSHGEIKEFEAWFDKYIGTEIEINDNGNGWYAMCFDMNMREVKKCRKWEERND